MGLGDDWRAALERGERRPRRAGRAGRPQGCVCPTRRSPSWRSWDLLTVEELCRETWRIDMIEAEKQRMWPFAVGGKDGDVVPVDEMDHETKRMSLRGNNVHFTRNVTPHELIPGHHLRLYMADRYNAHRRVFRTPSSSRVVPSQGDALLGPRLGADPRSGSACCSWRAHRCVRIIRLTPVPPGADVAIGVVDSSWTRGPREVLPPPPGAPVHQRHVSSALPVRLHDHGLQVRDLYKELVGDPSQPDAAPRAR